MATANNFIETEMSKAKYQFYRRWLAYNYPHIKKEMPSVEGKSIIEIIEMIDSIEGFQKKESSESLDTLL